MDKINLVIDDRKVVGEPGQTIYETAKFFFDNSKSVHITLMSGQWLNGRIVSLSEDRLVLVEEKMGEMLILFERIKDDGIEPREVRE